jgi:hypothetical protein
MGSETRSGSSDLGHGFSGGDQINGQEGVPIAPVAGPLRKRDKIAVLAIALLLFTLILYIPLKGVVP